MQNSTRGLVTLETTWGYQIRKDPSCCTYQNQSLRAVCPGGGAFATARIDEDKTAGTICVLSTRQSFSNHHVWVRGARLHKRAYVVGSCVSVGPIPNLDCLCHNPKWTSPGWTDIECQYTSKIRIFFNSHVERKILLRQWYGTPWLAMVCRMKCFGVPSHGICRATGCHCARDMLYD